MYRVKITALLALLLLVFSACTTPTEGGLSDDGPAADGAIEGPEWKLVEINGAAPLDGPQVTLKLENKQAGGKASCNSYGGQYTLQGKKVAFQEVFQTEMACMDPAGVMDQESAYMQALLDTASFEMVGERLELKDANGETTLVFEK